MGSVHGLVIKSVCCSSIPSSRVLSQPDDDGHFTILKNTTSPALTEDETRSTYSQMR